MNLAQGLEKNKALISWRSSKAEHRLVQKIFPHPLMNFTGRELILWWRMDEWEPIKGLYLCGWESEGHRDIQRERESADVQCGVVFLSEPTVSLLLWMCIRSMHALVKCVWNNAVACWDVHLSFKRKKYALKSSSAMCFSGSNAPRYIRCQYQHWTNGRGRSAAPQGMAGATWGAMVTNHSIAKEMTRK